MGESAQVIVPRRRAHDAKLSPRAHICDRRRLHPCRAARQCVALNSFLATSLTSPPLPDSRNAAPRRLSDSPSRVPLCPTCSSKPARVCDGLVQSVQRLAPVLVPVRNNRDRTRRARLPARMPSGRTSSSAPTVPTASAGTLRPPMCHSLRLGRHRTTPCWAAMPSYLRTYTPLTCISACPLVLCKQRRN
jgi:hypothetical protein